jgi:hypothetical protein
VAKKKKFRKGQLVRVMYRKKPYVGKYHCAGGMDSTFENYLCEDSAADVGNHCVIFIDYHIEVKDVHPIEGLK